MLNYSEIAQQQGLSKLELKWDQLTGQILRDWNRAGMPEVDLEMSTSEGRRFYERCVVDCLEQNPELFFRYLYIVDVPEKWVRAWTNGAMKEAAELVEKIVERTIQKIVLREQFKS